MTLNILWFLLIAVLWVGYFVLEGFDFGVGALLHIVGRGETGRRVVINTIGPVWEGNQVWLITAAGATFAAFPEWYATLFSGFYIPMLIILLCLILRGLSFEYRGKRNNRTWRGRWDLSILVTSWILAAIWGLAFGNLIRGVELDADHEYVGGFFALLNPFALVMGATTLLLFLTHGAVYLALKTTDAERERARAVTLRLGPVAVVVLAIAVVWQQFVRGSVAAAIVGGVAVLALILAWVITRVGRDGWAFIMSTVSVAALTSGWFIALYPDVMPSSVNPEFSLNLNNAASSTYTLTVMTWVAAVMVPIVLVYEAWSYWIFRYRISARLIPPTPDDDEKLPEVAGDSRQRS